MRGKSLLLCLEIMPINFASHEIQPSVIRRYPAAPAPEVRIKDLISRLCVPAEYPII